MDNGEGQDRGGNTSLLAGPSHYAFSTRGLPAKARFEAWREVLSQMAGVEVSADAPLAFEGEFAARAAGPVRLVSSVNKGTRYDRTASLARNRDDDFSLTLAGDGFSVGSPQSDRFRVDAGSGFFLAHDRPFTITAADDAACTVLQIPRTSLIGLLPANVEFGTASFAAGSPVLELIKGYVPVLTSTTVPTLPEASEMMGRHIVDLVALLLRPSRDAFEVIEGRGLRAARTKAVLEAIARDYARPDLSVEAIGRKLGVSARQVHRLLEETPKTFYEHLLESRLQRAWKILSDPGGSTLPIAEVARISGFADLSHFNRSFRARFGDTPSGARGKAARAETLRFLREARAVSA